jgi:hypothetical protein
VEESHSIREAQTTPEARALRDVAAGLKGTVRKQDRHSAVACILVPILLVILKLVVEATTTVAVLYALVTLFALALGLDRRRGERLTAAARARERHDCDVLDMSWSTRAAGDEPDSDEITSWPSLVADGPGGKATGGDPFPKDIETLPLPFARLACQSLAVYWEPTAVRRYLATLAAGTGGIAIVLVAAGWALRPGTEDAITTLLALLPMGAWVMRERRRWTEAAAVADRVTERLSSAWRNAVGAAIQATSLTSLSRSIQDDIFAFRQHQPVIPLWAAKRYWQRLTYDARRIDQFVDQYHAQAAHD